MLKWYLNESIERIYKLIVVFLYMARKKDENNQKKKQPLGRPIIDNTFRSMWRTEEKFYPKENIVGQRKFPTVVDTKFEKIWLPNFLHILSEVFPSNNGRLLAYILEHRHRKTNIISLTPITLRPMNQRMIARESGINLSTVNRLFKKLEKCNPPLIRRTGPREYQINPLIIFKGRPEYRQEACARFAGNQPSSSTNEPHVLMDIHWKTTEPLTDKIPQNPIVHFDQIKDKLLKDILAGPPNDEQSDARHTRFDNPDLKQNFDDTGTGEHPEPPPDENDKII